MMSSRRKSSTPCMVQSDLSAVREGGASDDSDDDDVTQNERFPGADVKGVATATVGVASAAVGVASAAVGVASAAVGVASAAVGGGFECKYCSFRTTELKLFTDHVDLQHPTIITTSRYVCEECDYVTNSYDSLQLHNSRCHPGEDSFTVTMATQNSRTVTFRQSVNELSFSGSFVKAEEEAPLSPAHTPRSPSLSLLSPALLSSKPPAAVKLESESDDDEMPVLSPAPVTPATPPLASQAPPLVSANQSFVVNGSSGSTIKGGGILASGTLAQVLAALQTQAQTQAGPAQTQTQTQLLIPVSCIPTYSPSMDQNLLLISAFNRFPYPSLSEILSLSSRTQFSEEQIRVWFSAQRLKHGVSWTPEEVEEARRKKSNGAVQAPPTIAVIPANLTANGLQSLFQTCHIITQLPNSNANVLTQLPNANVLTQLPNANVLTQLPNANVLTPVPNANANTVALAVAPPTNPAPDSAPDSAPLPDLGPNKPKKSKEQLAELKASYARRTFATETEISRLMQVTNLSKRAIKKWFSDTRYNQRNSRDHQAPPTATEATPPIVIDSDDTDSAPLALKPGERENSRRFKEKSWEQRLHLERSFQTSAQPSEEELSRLRGATKMTRRELQAWFNHRRQTKQQSESQTSPDKKLSEGNQDRRERRRLPQGGSSEQCPSAPPSGRPLKVKKSPEQLAVLKRAFVRSQWPTASEYNRLSSETGLPRTDIVNWFGDARYSAKNSSLKWFYLYHSGKGDAALNGGGAKRKPRKRFRGWSRRRRVKRPSVEFSTVKVKSGTWFLKDYFRHHGDLSETDLDELVSKSGLSYERVRDWFKTVRTREEQGLQGFSQSEEEEEEGSPEHQENMENQEEEEEEEVKDVDTVDMEDEETEENMEENMEENPDDEEHMDLDSEQIFQTDDDDLEQTSQSQPEEAETGQSQPEEVETGQSQPEEAETGQSQPEEAETGQSQPEEAETGQSQPEEAETGQSQPEEAETGQSQPEEAETGQSQPEEAETGQSEAEENTEELSGQSQPKEETGQSESVSGQS